MIVESSRNAALDRELIPLNNHCQFFCGHNLLLDENLLLLLLLLLLLSAINSFPTTYRF
jgi:hypothetical protein